MAICNRLIKGFRYILFGIPTNRVTAEISYLSESSALTGKKIIITGGGRGLGAAMAE